MRIDSEPSLDPSDYEFSHTVRVRFSETDAMGIVHHSRYLPYMEEARVEYLRHIGHPYHEIRDAGIEMAVLEAFLHYRLPLQFAGVVTVHGQIRATGVTAHGALTPEGNATRLPDWFRDFTPPARAT